MTSDIADPSEALECVIMHHLVRARNATTTYIYYWCPIHELVIKDLDSDGMFRGHRIMVARRMITAIHPDQHTFDI